MNRTARRIAILLAISALPQAASAHAMLKSAVPAVGGTSSKVPTEVTIEYTEAVEPTFSKIEVQDAAGARVDTGTVRTAPDDDARLVVPLKPLAPGTYKVTWHVTSKDSHKTKGSFSFTVRP